MTTAINIEEKDFKSSLKDIIDSQSDFLKEDVSKNRSMLISIEDEKRGLNIINELKLRFVGKEDIDVLKELCDEWFPIKYPDSWYNLIACDERFCSLAATYHDNIVAVLIAEIKPRLKVLKEDSDLLASSFTQDTKVAYILSLGVHKPFRRQGIASFMLHNFLASTCAHEHLMCKEVKAIYLHVLSSNCGAIKFYEQHKFRQLHFLPAYYIIDGKPQDGFSYVLHINGGKPPATCSDYFYNLFAFVLCFHPCKLPSKFLFGIRKLLKYFMAWPTFSPILSKNRQCHNL